MAGRIHEVLEIWAMNRAIKQFAAHLDQQRAATNGLRLPIYLDNHATTAVDPGVLEEMLPYFQEKFGNAASCNHEFGWTAEKAVALARERIARLIGAKAGEIIFTSGATESDNLAIKGVAEKYRTKGNHIVTAVTEHKAVLDSCKRLEKYGFRVTYLGVQRDGLIDVEELRRAIGKEIILVTIMTANNEIGVLQPIAEIGEICRERGVIFHTDATQAVGKVPVNVNEQNVDLLSISSHKMYGPKGVGALYVRSDGRDVEVAAMLDGGGHELGMRSGTLNVPGIVGLGKACAIAAEEMPEEAKRLANLRDRLCEQITRHLDGCSINGSMEQERRLPGNLNISFADVDGESLLMGLNDVAVSSGSACNSGAVESSYVLKALGVSEELAQSSLRFGIGRFNTEAEIDYAANRIVETVKSLREISAISG
jgi:cysteine desulfurase